MDIARVLTAHPDHDPAWVRYYLEFIQEDRLLGDRFERHHVLPRSIFPEFSDLDAHPWNQKDLNPEDHLLAHYYLYRALPLNACAAMAFRMMVGVYNFNRLRHSGFRPSLLQGMCEAYARAKAAGRPWSEEARARMSEKMKGQPVPEKFTFKGRRHTVSARQSSSKSHVALHEENGERRANYVASRPRGYAHWTFNTPRPESTRRQISLSLTGKVQSQATIDRRRATLDKIIYDQIPSEEHAAFEHALTLTTEDACILHRRSFPTNSRPYNILTGLMHIRLGRTSDVEVRYWQQAQTWLDLTGHTPEGTGDPTPLAPRDASMRLGTGHALLPGQKSAHELRKAGRNKGVVRARQNFDEIPQDEREMLLSAWQVGNTEALVAARKQTATRSRPYNILFGMQWIRENKATPETFERWRQAALFLHFTQQDYVIPSESLQELRRLTS